MKTTVKTGCVQYGQNGGLEVEVERNRIVRVKEDKTNVKSEGYVCRYAMIRSILTESHLTNTRDLYLKYLSQF